VIMTTILNQTFDEPSNDDPSVPASWSLDFDSPSGSASIRRIIGDGHGALSTDSSDSTALGFMEYDATARYDYICLKQSITPATNRLEISLWIKVLDAHPDAEFRLYIGGSKVFSESVGATTFWKRISGVSSVAAGSSVTIKFGVYATAAFTARVEVQCDYIQAWDCSDSGYFLHSFTLPVGYVSLGPGRIKLVEIGSMAWFEVTDPHGDTYDVFLASGDFRRESWSAAGGTEYWRVRVISIDESSVTLDDAWWLALSDCERYASEDVWLGIAPSDSFTGTRTIDSWATFPHARDSTPANCILNLNGNFTCPDGNLKPANSGVIYKPVSETIITKT